MRRLRALLEDLYVSYGPAHLATDPVEIVRGLADPADREVGGLLVAALALGRVDTIRSKAREALDRAGGAPAAFAARAAADAGARRAFRGFRHRFFVGADVVRLLAGAGRLLDRHGSLAQAFAAADGGEPDVAPALGRFCRALDGGFLFPSPGRGSAAKRAFLYLRWMVRRDGVDLGLWPVDPARLLLPLDVHVGRIARLLGLLRRRSNDLAAAREATAALRRLDPADPVRYDFALARLGIVEGCRGRWHAGVCPTCPILEVCAASRAGSTALERAA